MRRTMLRLSAAVPAFAVVLLFAAGCITRPETQDSVLVPSLSFQPGYEFAGSFFAAETVPRNTPTVLGIVALPNSTELSNPVITLECAAIPPPGEQLPRKFILSLRITDSTGAPLASDQAKLKIRPDGNCKTKSLRLDVLSYPPGSMAELTVEMKGRNLVKATHVAYQVNLS